MKKTTIVGLGVFLAIVLGMFATNASAAEKPRWGKIRHKCTTESNGLVWAKLKGVKLGKKMKTCKGTNGRTPPTFNAKGASGEPDKCKRKPTGIYGYWDIPNDPLCKDGKKNREAADAPYWDKPKHWCASPGVGKVEARLLGVKGKLTGRKQRKFDLCNSDGAPTLNVLGASGRATWCQKRVVHVYGRWTIKNDELCEPVWGEVKKKGCLGPDADNGGTKDRQARRAKLKKLKNGAKWWQITKWKWPLTKNKRAWARSECLKQEHPTKGKPDYCKVQNGIWAYWYDEVQQCKKPLEWTRFKDDGCVADMETPNLSGNDLVSTGMRSYSARLKHAKGDLLTACKTWSVNNQKANNDTVLDVARPTGCLLNNADGVIAHAVGIGAAGATLYLSSGTSAAATAEIYVGTAAGTAVLLNTLDLTTSVDGVVWVEDSSCR
jgi:hypothetical protein